ncbi:pyridoxamine 5'-phosphate oxidase family protein [uncultured Sulfitobacter sp.]|uniref:pyridoxamine 5'-phosphate oxidase family protein n=1 Tax=uncultured Sulfitobacter sp. TaxID=191468 RepID=UPI00260409B3|nr:pyridoxamine 5'-phosphate oxidase family protein [uncultured Sulfitobacter sp.]
MSDTHTRFWEILSDMQVCMVTTEDAGLLRGRPMAPFIDTNTRTIHFVTDSESAKIYEMNKDADIALGFADTSKMVFASVSGKGIISRDRDLIRKLWGPYCDVFFDGGAENADVAVIRVAPTQAEYWDNDKGKVAMAAEMTRAYFTDGGPDLGENAKLDL